MRLHLRGFSMRFETNPSGLVAGKQLSPLRHVRAPNATDCLPRPSNHPAGVDDVERDAERGTFARDVAEITIQRGFRQRPTFA